MRDLVMCDIDEVMLHFRDFLPSPGIHWQFKVSSYIPEDQIFVIDGADRDTDSILVTASHHIPTQVQAAAVSLFLAKKNAHPHP